MTTLDEFTTKCAAKVEAIYGRGERLETWHVIFQNQERPDEYVIGSLAQTNWMPLDVMRRAAVSAVRSTMRRFGLTMFGVACESWMIDESGLSSDPAERDAEIRRMGREGVRSHPNRFECITMTTFSADGATKMRSWEIAYDDMRKARLGKPMLDFDVEPGQTDAGVETWWKRVFPLNPEARP